MATYSLSGAFGWAGGGKAGAIVDIWATSRFSGPPAEGQAPPSGSPDFGPVTTGPDFGSPGGFVVEDITVLQDYYVRVQYGNQTFWGSRSANDLTGAPVASGVTNVTGDETSIHVVNGTTVPLISLVAATGDVTWSAGSTATTLHGTSNVNTVVGSLSSVIAKANTASPTFTGIPIVPTASPGTNDTQAASTAYVDAAIAALAAQVAPIGTINLLGAAGVPTNWHLCDGTAVSRTTFSALFALYGTTWGVGDGSTTFNLPDLRDRLPMGAHTTLALGATGGSQTITNSNLPAHSHGVTDPTHSHLGPPAGTTSFVHTAASSSLFLAGSGPQAVSFDAATSAAGTGVTTQNDGGGSAYLPPAAGINYIIRLL